MISEAVEAVKSSALSYRQAASKYNCSRSSIYDHVHGMSKSSNMGRPNALTKEEEKDIVRCCEVLGRLGVCANRETVGKVIKDYLAALSRPNPFWCGVPGQKWWREFLKRWPELSERKPEHLTVQRAKAASPSVINNFFSSLTDFQASKGLSSLSYGELGQRMWNCDETGISTSVASQKVLVKRGSRDVSEIGSGSGREYITNLFCGSAVGERLSPYVVYKAETLDPSWTVGGPQGTRYVVSSSGWMETAQFHEWFLKMFLPAIEGLLKTGPVLLFVDGHNSHLAIDLLGLARANNVTIYCLPPNTTHILQPLDVAVFGPLKRVWRRKVKEYKLTMHASKITKHDFPALLSSLFHESVLPEHLVSGFRATGIHPLSKEAIKPYKLEASAMFAPEEHQQMLAEHLVVASPVTSRVETFFAKFFLERKEEKQKKTGGRIRPKYYGEALTEDEAFDRLREQKLQKEAKKSGKKRRQKGSRNRQQQARSEGNDDGDQVEEEVCQVCGDRYDDDDSDAQEFWVGCDRCPRWFHYLCVNLPHMPESEEPFICPAC